MTCAVRRPRWYLLARRWWREQSWLVRDMIETAVFLALAWGGALSLLFLGA